MDGDLKHEMVVGAGGGSQIPDPHVTVGADCAEHAVGVGTPLDAVRARMGRESEQALFPLWVPYLD